MEIVNGRGGRDVVVGEDIALVAGRGRLDGGSGSSRGRCAASLQSRVWLHHGGKPQGRERKGRAGPRRARIKT